MFYGDPLSVELSKMNISLKSAVTKLTNDYYKMVKIGDCSRVIVDDLTEQLFLY